MQGILDKVISLIKNTRTRVLAWAFLLSINITILITLVVGIIGSIVMGKNAASVIVGSLTIIVTTVLLSLVSLVVVYIMAGVLHSMVKKESSLINPNLAFKFQLVIYVILNIFGQITNLLDLVTDKSFAPIVFAMNAILILIMFVLATLVFSKLAGISKLRSVIVMIVLVIVTILLLLVSGIVVGAIGSAIVAFVIFLFQLLGFI